MKPENRAVFLFVFRTTFPFLVLEHSYLTLFAKLILYSTHPSVLLYDCATNAHKWILPNRIEPFLLYYPIHLPLICL